MMYIFFYIIQFAYFLANFLLFFFGKMKFVNIQKFVCNNNLIVPHLWSIYGSTSNFNIALPDAYAEYRGSFICLNDNDVIILESDVPYARYYSVQLYDSTTASLGSLNDYQIVTTNNKFTINITKKKDMCDIDACQNNKNTLYVNTKDSFLVLIYRVYDVPINDPNIQPKIGTDKLFGWIEPPNIYKYDMTTGKVTNISNTKTYTPIGLPRMYRNIDPVREHRFANENNNFFKPTTNAFFSNDDANYLVSLIKVPPNGNLGAVITGYLPKTDYNNKNYFKKVKGNFNESDPDYYEVKYVSFNMGTTSNPLPTIAGHMLHNIYSKTKVPRHNISSTGTAGIRDTDIINRYNNSHDWNQNGRPYKIYIGRDVNHIVRLGADPNVDLYMLYPVSYPKSEFFTYAVIVFRYLMSQEKFLSDPIYKNGIGAIISNPALPQECAEKLCLHYPKIEFI